MYLIYIHLLSYCGQFSQCNCQCYHVQYGHMHYDRVCLTLCKIKTGNSISSNKKDGKDKYIILQYFIEILSKLKCSIEIHCTSYTFKISHGRDVHWSSRSGLVTGSFVRMLIRHNVYWWFWFLVLIFILKIRSLIVYNFVWFYYHFDMYSVYFDL